jgi:hypothetical protein
VAEVHRVNRYFRNIGWKFYLCFIVLSGLFAIYCFFFFPDTRGLPIEEIALLFGDATEVYQVATAEEESEVANKADGVFEKTIENA